MHYPMSYKFGKEQEAKVLSLLREHFGRDIQPYKEQYAKHDFFCDEMNYELKSRNVRRDSYPDTMITANKLCGEKPLCLLFSFTDCLTYIMWDVESFKQFRCELFGREGSEQQQHYYIPIENLTTIKMY